MRKIITRFGIGSVLPMAVVSLLFANSSPAQTILNWSGSGGDANWSNPANWAGTAPTNGERLIFSGTTQQNNFNDLSGYTNGLMVFSNGGFNLSGNPITVGGGITNLAGTNVIGFGMSVETSGTKVWYAAPGSEVQFVGSVSSVSNPQQDFSGGGSIRLLGGMGLTAIPLIRVLDASLIVDACSLSTLGGIRIGYGGGAGSGQIIVTNGGILSIGGSSALRLGESSTGILTISSGKVDITGTGGIHLGQTTSGKGTLTQTGGEVKSTIGGMTFSIAGSGDGTYNLNGGTLTTLFISKTSASGTAVMNFNGGTLKPWISSDTFMTGLNTASIKSGGLVIDTDFSDITIGQIFSGSGPLTKNNEGALTLTGASTHSGSITINGGKLFLTTARKGAGAITVNDGTEFGMTVAAANSNILTSALTLGSASGCTLDFDLATFGNPTVPLIVATNLTTQGTVAVKVTGSPLATGQFKLIAYNGTIGGSDFAAFGSLTLPDGVSGYLSNNIAESSVDLVVTSAPGFTWSGNVNGDWDFSTFNWTDDATGSPAAYQDGIARFPNNAARGNVNLTATFNPTALVISNSTLAYNFSGSGSANTPSLRKQGSGIATFSTSTPFSFGRIDLDSGTLAFQYPGDATFTNVFAGSGNLIFNGTGTSTLQANSSSYTGNTLIQSGTVKAGNGSALGGTNGSITITNGGTFDINDQGFGLKPFIVSGTGVNGQGAMIDSTSAGAIQIASVNVTMAGDTTFGCNGRWDIRAQAPTAGSPGLRGNGFKLTKVGSGFLSIASQAPANTYWFLNLGNIDIQAGTLTFAEQVNWGDTNKTVTIADGAGLNFFGLGITNPAAGNVYMTNAFFRSDGGGALTNIFNGPIALFGATNTFDVGAPLIVNAPISGSGVLSQINTGRFEVNASSPFSGTLLVSAGGTLGGNGSVAGDVVFASGVLSPGSSIGQSIGTFSVGGSLFATNGAVFEIDRDAAQNSDRANVTGTIALGGTVVVTNIGAALQGGESFALFNKAISGSFTNLVLPTLAGGLSWVNQLDVDGTIRVAGSSAPPQFGSISVSGGNVQLSGTGGVAGATFYVVASPDISVPVTNWTAVATNQFDGSGNFSASLPLAPGQPQLFYTIRLP